MDEDKAILTLISTVLMHALIRSNSPTDQIVFESVSLAQQLVDEVNDVVENG